jgi:hypothetical protein
MSLRSPTAIVHPVIHLIWMGDSLVLAAFKFVISTGFKKKDPILFGKLSHPVRFLYFKK